jgi:hypothetical protein
MFDWFNWKMWLYAGVMVFLLLFGASNPVNWLFWVILGVVFLAFEIALNWPVWGWIKSKLAIWD